MDKKKKGTHREGKIERENRKRGEKGEDRHTDKRKGGREKKKERREDDR
jgi:hypothetical protein